MRDTLLVAAAEEEAGLCVDQIYGGLRRMRGCVVEVERDPHCRACAVLQEEVAVELIAPLRVRAGGRNDADAGVSFSALTVEYMPK